MTTKRTAKTAKAITAEVANRLQPMMDPKPKRAFRVVEVEGRFALVNAATGEQPRSYTYKTARAATAEGQRFGYQIVEAAK